MLTLAAALTLSGCTVIGLGMDIAHRDPRAGEGAALSQLRKVRPGAHLAITKRDGSRVEGELTGIATQSSVEWRERAAARRDSLEAWRTLPAPGDTVRLVQSALFRAAVEYQGLGARGVLVRDTGKLESREVAFSDFTALRSGGVTLERDDLRSRALDPEVPTEAVVRMNVRGERTETRLQDAASWVVTRPAPREPRWTLAGILADVLVLVWINTTFIYSG